ncbi:MAG: AAA family ATPase, partial [Actinobacteria bacterium]|nr:AAA family ATPase [Actinomycetota bacterium]
MQVVTCSVEAQAPHRISRAWTMPLIPAFLTPRLPSDFSGTSLLAGRGAASGSGVDGRTRLVVFSGVPGTGKSTLADAAGRELGIPVFAVDWLLGSLTPFGGYHFHQMLDIGMEMLTTLALRQLQLGQSAILDCPVEDVETRNRWRTLAQAAGSQLRVVVCA